MKVFGEIFEVELDEFAAEREIAIQAAKAKEDYEIAMLIKRNGKDKIFFIDTYHFGGSRPCIVSGIDDSEGAPLMEMFDVENGQTYRIHPREVLWSDVKDKEKK